MDESPGKPELSAGHLADAAGCSRRLGLPAMGRLGVTLVVLGVAATAALAWASPFGPGEIRRVSVSSQDAEANGASFAPSVSSDGRYLVFTSLASNLVPNDTNGCADVFLRDLATGVTSRVSVSPSGVEGDAASGGAYITPNGRRIAFFSKASNLVAGDANGVQDAFVRDIPTGKTTRVSVSSAGAQGDGESWYPVLSADGDRVAFFSNASNLVSDDGNGLYDTFVRDLTTGKTTRVSVDAWGHEDYNHSYYADLSADGRYIAFESLGYYLVPGSTGGHRHIYLRDLETGSIERVSVSSEGQHGWASSGQPDLSPDGRLLAFRSEAVLAPNDTNGVLDIYVRDLHSRVTTLASVSSEGTPGNDWSSDPSLSSDGRFVTFFSKASNLVPGDTNSTMDVFVRDLLLGETTRVNLSQDGLQGNGDCWSCSISEDGHVVAFDSDASVLVAGDVNASRDVFVFNRMESESTITIASSSRVLSAYGQSYRLNGSLLCSDAPLADRRVVLQSSTRPTGPWSETSVQATTTSDGSFVLAHTPSSKTYYRARFGGDSAIIDGTESGYRCALPRALVGNPVAPATMYRGRSATMYGYLAPRHSRGTHPVKVYTYRLVAGHWERHGSVWATAYDYGSKTKYRASLKLPYQGRWRIRAYHPADARHAASWSAKYDYITVR